MTLLAAVHVTVQNPGIDWNVYLPGLFGAVAFVLGGVGLLLRAWAKSINIRIDRNSDQVHEIAEAAGSHSQQLDAIEAQLNQTLAGFPPKVEHGGAR